MAREDARCGACHLWGANFYPRLPGWPVNTTCAADAVMDLPASFIPDRQTMTADQGAGCICWMPLPAAVVQPQHPSHDGQAQSASPNGDDAREFGEVAL